MVIIRVLNHSIVLVFSLFFAMLAFSIRPGVDDLAFLDLCSQNSLSEIMVYNFHHFNFRISYPLYCYLVLKLSNSLVVVKFIFPLVHLCMLLLLYFGLKRIITNYVQIKISKKESYYAAMLAFMVVYFGTMCSIEVFGSAINCFNYLYPLIASMIAYFVINSKLSTLTKMVVLLPLTILIIGGAENITLLILTSYFTYIFIHRNWDQIIKRQHFIFFCILALFTVGVFLAPGNFNRLHIENSHPVSKADISGILVGMGQVWILFVMKFAVSFGILVILVGNYFRIDRLAVKRSLQICAWLLIFNLVLWIALSLVVFNGEAPLRLSFATNICALLFVFLAVQWFVGRFWNIFKPFNNSAHVLIGLFLLFYFIKHGTALMKYSSSYDERLSIPVQPSKIHEVDPLPPSDIVINGDITSDTAAYMNKLYKRVYGNSFVIR